MKTLSLLLTSIVLAAGIVGCGGAGFRGPTDLAGSWAGVWTDSTSQDLGVLSLTFNNKSTFVGTVKDLATGEVGDFSGDVGPAHKFDGYFNFMSGRSVHVAGNIGGPTSGPSGVVISADANFEESGKPSKTMTFEASNQIKASPFIGVYNGGYATTDGSRSGTWSFTVAYSGDITGFFSDTVTGKSGTVEGGIYVDGQFKLALIDDSGRVTISAAVVNGAFAGSLVHPGGPKIPVSGSIVSQ